MLDISRVSFEFAPGDDQVSVWYDANGECALIGQTQDGQYALVYIAGREEFLHHAFDPTDPGDGFYVHGCHLRFDPRALAPRSSNIELGQLLVAANRVSILTHTGLDRLLFVGLMTKPLREGLEGIVLRSWSVVSENPDGKLVTLFQYGEKQRA